MTTRRSRPPRSRKPRTSEPPQTDVAALTSRDPLVTLGGHVSRAADPTVTGQLRALEAGWDELLT
jgi:hypothetical protein